MEIKEKELHVKAIAGDDEAFLAVMQLHKEPLLRTALAFLQNEDDAIEALQEVTYRAYKKVRTVKEPNLPQDLAHPHYDELLPRSVETA